MTINSEEIELTTARFGGVDRSTDPADLPLGVFSEAYNLQTFAEDNYIRTRDGYVQLSGRLFSEATPLLGGVLGGKGLVSVPYVNPDSIDDLDDDGNYALRLTATPVESVAPETVSFTVYGATELGISTLNWDFSFNDTRNTDESGSSSTVTHLYSNEGTYDVQVWGTGSDGLEYSSTLTVSVTTGDPPEALPTASITVNGKSSNFTMEPGTARIRWATTNSHTTYLDGSEVAKSGSRTASLAEGTYIYTVMAFDSQGRMSQDSITVKVEGDADPELPPLINLNPVPLIIDNGDSVEFKAEIQDADEATLYVNDKTYNILGGSVTLPVSRPTGTSTTDDYTVPCNAVAVNEFGSAESSSEIIIRGDDSDYRRSVKIVKLTVPERTVDEATFSVTADFYESDGTTPAALEAEKSVKFIMRENTAVADNYSGLTVVYNDDRTSASIANATLNIDDASTSPETAVTYAIIEDTNVKSTDYETEVYVQTVTVTTSVLDSSYNDITELTADIIDGRCVATCYLKVEVDDYTVDADIELSAYYVAGWPMAQVFDSDKMNVGAGASWSDATAVNTIKDDDNDPFIPHYIMLQGEGVVYLRVNVDFEALLGAPHYTGSTDPHYLDVTLEGQEVING